MGREIIEQLGRDRYENDLSLSVRLVASELREPFGDIGNRKF